MKDAYGSPGEIDITLGLGLITVIVVGSLWACIGFVCEWAASEMGIPREALHLAFKTIGLTTCAAACALGINALKKYRNYRRRTLLWLLLYVLLLTITPRSLTYDTGLYHIPLINHLSEIGLEWNLGWLHKRYGFFNLLLYGQSALSRLAGTLSLPSLNGLILVATMMILVGSVNKNPQRLAPACLAAGALLIPSEATESFHSYNADFALGCIFLTTSLIACESFNENKRIKNTSICILLLMPLIKISGLLLVPIVLPVMAMKWGWPYIKKNCRATLSLVAAGIFTAGLSGYITTGYLSYPIAKTGPLRVDAISKEETVKESSLYTVAWSRYAYSNQVDAMKENASLNEWFPKWSGSLNGKRMLSYLTLSIVAACILNRDQKAWRNVLVGNAVFWCIAIIGLPPDPRFYQGPALVSVYGLGVGVNRILRFPEDEERVTKIFLVLVISMAIMTSLWRSSELARGEMPRGTVLKEVTEVTGYKHTSKTIRKASDGLCWTIQPPCMP